MRKKHTKLWEWQERIKKGEGECAKCGGKIGLTIDHIVPQSLLQQFGLDDEIYEYELNFQILCRFCNQVKQNRMDFSTNPKTLSLLKYFVALLEVKLKQNND